MLIARTEITIDKNLLETTVANEEDEQAILLKPVSLLDEKIDIKVNKLVTPQASINKEEAEEEKLPQPEQTSQPTTTAVQSAPSKKKSSKSIGVSCFSCRTKKGLVSSDIIEVNQSEPAPVADPVVATSPAGEVASVSPAVVEAEVRSEGSTAKLFLNLDRRSSQKPSDTPSLYSSELSRPDKSEKSHTLSYELKEPDNEKNRTASLIGNSSMENLLTKQQDSRSETNSAEEKVKVEAGSIHDVGKLPDVVTVTETVTETVTVEEKQLTVEGAKEEAEKSVSCFGRGKTKKANKKGKKEALSTKQISLPYKETVMDDLKQNLANEPVTVGSCKKLAIVSFSGLDRADNSEVVSKTGK